MKTWIKAYKASTWKTYRVVIFVVYPLVLLTYRFICIAAMILNSGDSEVSPYLTFALLEGFGFLIIFLFETISDIYIFPGIYAKDTGFAAIPRTSLRGKEVMVGALKGNRTRSILVTAIYFASALIGPALASEDDLWKYIFLALGILVVTFASVQAAVFWLRHITNMSMAGLPLMVVYLIAMLAIAGLTYLIATRLETGSLKISSAELAIIILFQAFARANIRKAESMYDAGFAAEEEK